jgi:hypothetical protein
MKIEDKIQFGEYIWRVLAIQRNTALIITDKIIEQRYIIMSMLKLLGRIVLCASISTLSFITGFRKKKKQE